MYQPVGEWSTIITRIVFQKECISRSPVGSLALYEGNRNALSTRQIGVEYAEYAEELADIYVFATLRYRYQTFLKLLLEATSL